MQVGYLGPRGTFTEEASLRYFSGSQVEWKLYSSILDVLDGVQAQEVVRGVVPIENTIEGSVNMTLDGLAEYPDLFVEAEIVLPIEQNLLVKPGTELQQIKEIWSHPQALAQCRNFIRQIGAKTKAWDSTAAAAAELEESDRTDVGAIGTSWAAKKFGLNILQSNLQDSSENQTRFVIIRKNKKALSESDHSMLLITLIQDRAGALVHVLNVFAAFGLNLTRIESRPTRKRLGTYQFFIDVDAGMEDARLMKTISVIGTFGHQVRVLGSYRKYKKN